MFTFGLFSTHMPYVVMVVFYVFYFLFSSPTLKNIAETKVDHDIPDTEVLQTQKETQLELDNFCFADFQVNENTFKYRKPLVFDIFYSPPEAIPDKDGFYNSFHCRPPPFIS